MRNIDRMSQLNMSLKVLNLFRCLFTFCFRLPTGTQVYNIPLSLVHGHTRLQLLCIVAFISGASASTFESDVVVPRGVGVVSQRSFLS